MNLKNFWHKIRQPGWTTEAQKITTDLGKIDLSKFIEALDSPVIKLAGSNLPFVSLGLTALRIYLGETKQKPTLESSIIIASQMAYLQSLGEVINRSEKKEDISKIPVSYLIEGYFEELENVTLNNSEQNKAIADFNNSKLAAIFNPKLTAILTKYLENTSWSSPEIERLVKAVSWETKIYIERAIATGKEEVEPLKELYKIGGNLSEEIQSNIESYLEEKIEPLPNKQLFDEKDPKITIRDLYVQLKIQPLDEKGNPTKEESQNIHKWMSDILDSDEKQRKLLFIQGEAGRGKSTFCRMFTVEVLSLWYPAFIPILIRLRDLINISDLLLKDTLKAYLQNWTFACSERWLSERSRRYLLIFDGLDELALQNRRSEGVEKLLQQIESFQKNSHHQCIVTGRPLVLQGINLDRIITQTKNLKRVKIELMDDDIREEWLKKWAIKVGKEEKQAFYQFLQQCPEAVNKLAREPLLLYLLARMHREERLSIQKFAEKSETEIKIKIYSESIKWVLEKQRENQNFRITGLETEDLREFLREAALCIVQLGNETAPLNAIEARLKDDYNPIKELIKKATEETKTDEKKALNNLLTCFYIKPGAKDPSGSIEFTHKSFGEFLFAEKLTKSLEKWTELDSRGKDYNLNCDRMAEEIYDLLGYGGLTPEIVEYLTGMLYKSEKFKPVELFERLEYFFDRWCNGEFIDGKFIDATETTLAQKKGTTLPLEKMRQLKAQKPDSNLGQRQVDVYAGLNIMILLLELHRYAIGNNLEEKIAFYPCGQLNEDREYKDPDIFLKVINYANSIEIDNFRKIVGEFLSSSNLNWANLGSVNLSGTKLNWANLDGTNLYKAALDETKLNWANLNGAKLNWANLDGADLNWANLDGANLTNVNLVGANLNRAKLNWANLGGANLTNVNLVGAKLERASLTGAKLKNADLTKAIGLTPEQVKSAENWELAIFSPEFREKLGLPPES